MANPSPLPGALPAEADLVVLGSGAAGLTAAVTAALQGLSVVVLEHLDGFGGTSARSSGTVWVPGNRAMRAAGFEDAEPAARYLAALVGDRAPEAIWRRFLSAAPAMQADLEDRIGLLLRPFPAAPDYRQDFPGAAPGWRAMEPPPFDGRRLGPLFDDLAPPLPELMVFGGMMVTRAEAAALLQADRSPRSALLGARLTARYLADRLRGRRGTRLVLGNALVAHLLHAAAAAGVVLQRAVTTTRLAPDASGTVLLDLATEAGPHRLRARRGVVLAGGGFPADPAWRERDLPHPTPAHTPASPGARGETLRLALRAGAALGPSGLDNALWFPSSVMTRADGSTAVWPHIVLDRAKPGSLCIDLRGERFVNEAVSYHEFVRAMYRAARAVPCWMICDRRFIRRYGLGLIRPRTPSLRRFLRAGYLVEAPDVGALAGRLGLPRDALAQTLDRFIGFARAGRDSDFHRGETIYERANGDAGHRPNPCLGEIGTGPLYAVRLEPTPLGTSRGLLTDTEGRVLRPDGSVLAGLYACGNDMQSAFGGEYPGAGAQLGQGMTFAWLAARAAAEI